MQVVTKSRNVIVTAACLFAVAAAVQLHPRRQTGAGLNTSGLLLRAAYGSPVALSAAGAKTEDRRLSQHLFGPAMAAPGHYLRVEGFPLSNGQTSNSHFEKYPFRIRPPPAA